MKTQKLIPPGTHLYHRLTRDDRIKIETLKLEGASCTHIAHQLGVSKSTISREFSRNGGGRSYKAQDAQENCDTLIRDKAERRRQITEGMWELVVSKLRDGWSFDQIAGRAKFDGVPMVSRETLYKEYYRLQRLYGPDFASIILPPLPMRRRKRLRRDQCSRKYRTAGCGCIPGRVDIDERPKVVDKRTTVGHWEGDLVNGVHGTGNLATLTERKTRYTLFDYVATKDMCRVSGCMKRLLETVPRELRATLTFDNGREFADFQWLEDELKISVYFAKPYHSWERGTNENRNGVVRKVLPKKSSFAKIGEEQMVRIDHMLNDRPLRCLGWLTPREAFAQECARMQNKK